MHSPSAGAARRRDVFRGECGQRLASERVRHAEGPTRHASRRRSRHDQQQHVELHVVAGGTYYVVTSVVSNYDTPSYQSAAIDNVSARTAAGLEALRASHECWWSTFYSNSFVEIGNKRLEKQWYGSLYLLASSARENEAAPGLWGNWIANNPAWNSDYTLNYNYEVPFLMALPTNHVDLAKPYDKPILDWVPNAQAQAAANGWTGAFYRVHIGPLPNGSSDTSTWNQKSLGAFAASNMIQRFYYTRDTAYANSVYGFLKEVALFWQNYLVFDGTRYVIVNDAQHEGDASPQTNGVMSLGLVRFLLQGCIDISSQLNVDASLRSTWQNILSRMSAFPTQSRNGETVFRYTEVGRDWNDGNSIGIQHIYPASQIGLDSDATLLQTARNTVGQMARWSDGNGTNTFYPAAARVGYNPSTILTQLDGWVAGNTYPNMFIHTGGGGVEGFNTVPATLSEMFVQSFQGKIRVFANWPSGTDAKFGDLLAYNNFLVSSEIRGERDPVREVRQSQRPQPHISQSVAGTNTRAVLQRTGSRHAHRNGHYRCDQDQRGHPRCAEWHFVQLHSERDGRAGTGRFCSDGQLRISNGQSPGALCTRRRSQQLLELALLDERDGLSVARSRPRRTHCGESLGGASLRRRRGRPRLQAAKELGRNQLDGCGFGHRQHRRRHGPPNLDADRALLPRLHHCAPTNHGSMGTYPRVRAVQPESRYRCHDDGQLRVPARQSPGTLCGRRRSQQLLELALLDECDGLSVACSRPRRTHYSEALGGAPLRRRREPPRLQAAKQLGRNQLDRCGFGHRQHCRRYGPANLGADRALFPRLHHRATADRD
jgi:hypothetical protein